MTKPWFKVKECTSLEIKKYRSISDHQTIRSVDIEDKIAVTKIMNRIERIDPDGKLMRSFSEDAGHIDLLFHCESDIVQKVEIYNHRFKTPSTGFDANESKTESSLYADIDALLFPGPGKRILKIKHLALRFKGFSLAYLGQTKSGNTPISLSWTSDRFLIRDSANREQIVQITSGQLPPKPYDFDIGDNSYALLTHQSESKERLYPDYFEIIKRGP